jgi:thiamine monophosphate kinase
MKKWFNGTKTELDLCLSALGGGDEYELCFSAPEKRRMELEFISRTLNIPLTRVGKVKTSGTIKNDKSNVSMKAEPKLTLISRNKKFDNISLPSAGFKHF